MNDAVKFCPQCSTRKPLTAFSKHRYVADGRQGHCKVCANAYGKAWRLANPKHTVSERVTR